MYAISYMQLKVSKAIHLIKNDERYSHFFEPVVNEDDTKIELIKDGFANAVLYNENCIVDNSIYKDNEYDFLLFSYKNDHGVSYKKILKQFKK